MKRSLSKYLAAKTTSPIFDKYTSQPGKTIIIFIIYNLRKKQQQITIAESESINYVLKAKQNKNKNKNTQNYSIENQLKISRNKKQVKKYGINQIQIG